MQLESYQDKHVFELHRSVSWQSSFPEISELVSHPGHFTGTKDKIPLKYQHPKSLYICTLAHDESHCPYA